MKTIAFSAIHFGLEYAAESIRSVIESVDEWWGLYSPTPSFGFTTDRPCPEHAADIFEACKAAAKDKFHWFTCSPNQWRSEGEHVDYIRTLAPSADCYLRLDLDEVFEDGLAAAAIDFGHRENAGAVRLRFAHLWRSFSRGMLHDPAFPVRLTFPNGDQSIDRTFTDGGRIWHFGYAQSSKVVEYKQYTNGHRNEWRHDWYETRFAVNAQRDVHPVTVGWWDVETIDPYELGLPRWMESHPYSKLDVIP